MEQDAEVTDTDEVALTSIRRMVTMMWTMVASLNCPSSTQPTLLD